MSPKPTLATVAAAVCWFALAAQLGLALHAAPSTPAGIAQAALAFLSFFTNLTNLLVAISLTLWTLGREEICRLTRPSGATALLAYLAVMSAVYAALLRDLWEPTGLLLLAEVIEHYVIPPLYLAYWLAYVPKGRLRWQHAYAWLLYPAAYGAFVAVRGAITGRYPYPFLDAAALGYARVLLNLVPLALLFLVAGLAFIALDRVLARRGKSASRLPAGRRSR